jgi:hypothetical protein
MKCKVIDDNMIEIDGNVYKITSGAMCDYVLQKTETYEVGDFFVIDGMPYILAKHIENCRVLCGFTSLRTGNRWADSVIVDSITNITECEIKRMIPVTNDYRKISTAEAIELIDKYRCD